MPISGGAWILMSNMKDIIRRHEKKQKIPESKLAKIPDKGEKQFLILR